MRRNISNGWKKLTKKSVNFACCGSPFWRDCPHGLQVLYFAETLWHLLFGVTVATAINHLWVCITNPYRFLERHDARNWYKKHADFYEPTRTQRLCFRFYFACVVMGFAEIYYILTAWFVKDTQWLNPYHDVISVIAAYLTLMLLTCTFPLLDFICEGQVKLASNNSEKNHQ